MKKCFISYSNHTCTLPLNKEYYFKILKACFDFSGTALQLMIALISIDDLEHDVIYEELKLGSPEFKFFTSLVYPVESHMVIDFDLNDITVFSGTTKIKKDDKNEKIHMDWESVNSFDHVISNINQSEFGQKNSNTALINKIRELLYEDDEDDVKNEGESQFMILNNEHKCTLPTTLIYKFHIVKACFSPNGNSVQMAVHLKNEEHNFRDTVYEEIPLKSTVFNKFVNIVYCGEWNDVIDFNPDRLSDFFGTVSIKQVKNNARVDWNTVEANSTPLSSAGILRIKWFEKDEYRYYRR